MKQKINFAHVSHILLLIGLIFFASFDFISAQTLPPNGTVIPTVCFEPKPETFTRILSVNTGPGPTITFAQAIPRGFYSVVFNPGGATEESRSFSYSTTGTNLFLTATGVPSQPLVHEHFAGETIVLTTDGDAAFGYHNTGALATIPRGVSSNNYFAYGPLIYQGQPSVFQSGRQENVFLFKTLASTNLTWFLNGGQAKFDPAQLCATITYQGRLNDAGSAANGQYDLQFQTFETETGGESQSGLITIENVQVTNGIFTVPLKFGNSLITNFKARFLQIGVRPGSAPNTDPFTILTPRQPITSVPYAVNAQNAVNAQTAANATNATNAVNSTNATNAVNAVNAVNATQLGGVEAANYLTNSSIFGQNVTTAFGGVRLQIDSTTTAYTLVPGLTQTVNVPANSSLFISTDGGIQSTGTASNSYSVVDVAIFVDGALAGQRRIVIFNNLLPSSVGNWALSTGQTLSAGNHTIEVKVRNGLASASPAVVGGDALLNGQLTIITVKK